jgi:predicted GIY-YIG superfamily endonuclease
MKELYSEQWKKLNEELFYVMRKKRNNKIEILKRKFNSLIKCTSDQSEIEKERDKFVINRSKVIFTEEEKEVLKCGLSFQPKMLKAPMDHIIVGVETAIKDIPNEKKGAIRESVKKVFDHYSERKKCVNKKDDVKMWKIIKSLKEKDVVYLRPDKGKGVVVMDRESYLNAANEHLENGPYDLVNARSKFPVDFLQRKVKSTLKDLCDQGLINEWDRRRLTMPNPRIPSFTCLPKIHKSGNQIRPVVSNVNSPTEKISEFLVKKIKSWKREETFSIKNSIEASKVLTSLRIGEDEIIASYDVQALYPSVPVNDSFEEFKDWTDSQEIGNDEKEICKRLMQLVLEQRWFTFNDKIYTQREGLFIGNPLSPILAELFMGRLEKEMKKEKWFPRFYLRFVDDIIVVIKKDDNIVLNELNSRHAAINFTIEKESEGKLPFLDLMIHREKDKITLDIYRKPTDAPLCIPNKSYHHYRHKLAAFESAFFRLCNLPLNEKRHKKELEYILNMGRLNGFESWKLKVIYEKHMRMTKNRNFTTLERISERKPKTIRTIRGREENKLAIVPFYAPITNELSRRMKKHNINVVFRNESTLKSLLGGIKRKTPDDECSGIYEIPCQDCEKVYIGQTRRRFETRESEHKEAIRQRMLQRSAVALHCHENRHRKGKGKIIKRISNPNLLDPWESLYIHNNNNLMNTGEPPIFSSLFGYANTTGRRLF